MNIDTFYYTATSTGTLEAQTYIRTQESTVSYIDVLYATRHFATYYETTVTVQYGVVFYNHILARFAASATVFIFSRFDTDSIVTGIKDIVDNQRVLARFQVQCITILGVPGVENLHIVNCDMLA